MIDHVSYLILVPRGGVSSHFGRERDVSGLGDETNMMVKQLH